MTRQTQIWFGVLLVLASIGLASSALAEVFTWDPPEFYADGVTPFEPSDLHEYRIYCGPSESPMMIVTRGQTVAYAALQPGSLQSCYVTAVSQLGLESAPSEVREFVVQGGQAPRCWIGQSAVTGLSYQYCNLWF